MKVLVTGAAGFLGRHFLAALDAHDVHAVDILSAAGVDTVDARDLFRGSDVHYDLVVHCAAVDPHRGAIAASPVAMGAGCMELDAGMWAWAARTRPGRVVYFSSCAAYPPRDATAGPMVETDIGDGTVVQPDMYGQVKLVGERMARAYAQAGGAVTVVRPFSGYGEDQDTRWPFGAFVDRARRRENPFTIWGSGDQVRDWVHVDDIVGAVLAAVREGVSGPVNIGTGRPTTLNELAEMVCQQAGYAPQFEHRLSAPTGPAYRVADTTRLNAFYTPTVSLEEGVARALG